MSICPTCKKSNCGNWAACARRGSQSEKDAYTAELVWYGIGVAEALFQVGVKSRDPFFMATLVAEGTAGVRKMLFAEALLRLDKELQADMTRKRRALW